MKRSAFSRHPFDKLRDCVYQQEIDPPLSSFSKRGGKKKASLPMSEFKGVANFDDTRLSASSQ